MRITLNSPQVQCPISKVLHGAVFNHRWSSNSIPGFPNFKFGDTL